MPKTNKRRAPTTPIQNQKKKSKNYQDDFDSPVVDPNLQTEIYTPIRVKYPLVKEGIDERQTDDAVKSLLSLKEGPPKKGGKTRKKIKRRKSLKKRKKRGGGNTMSNTKINCEEKKRKIREEIVEVKAALKPQFEMSEKVNVDNIGHDYTMKDLEDHLTYRGMTIDKGMSDRLQELYSRLQKILEECPDKKPRKKSKKTKRRKPRN